MMFKKLMHFGFSEKEAKIYIACLKLGVTTIQKIAKESKINRTTVYANIENLLKEKIIKKFIEEKKIYFYAENPNKIITQILKQQEIECENKKNILNKILPQLKAISLDSKNSLNINFYKGSNGIKEICKLILQGENQESYRVLYNHELFYQNFKKKELKELAYERIRKNIFAKIIRITNSKNIQSNQSEQINITTSKLNLSLEMSIFQNSILIVSLKKPISGISIKNKNISDNFKNIFDLIWNIMEKKVNIDKQNYFYQKSS